MKTSKEITPLMGYTHNEELEKIARLYIGSEKAPGIELFFLSISNHLKDEAEDDEDGVIEGEPQTTKMIKVFFNIEEALEAAEEIELGIESGGISQVTIESRDGQCYERILRIKKTIQIETVVLNDI